MREARNKIKRFYTDKLKHTTAEVELFIRFFIGVLYQYTQNSIHIFLPFCQSSKQTMLYTKRRKSRTTKTYLHALRWCHNAYSGECDMWHLISQYRYWIERSKQRKRSRGNDFLNELTISRRVVSKMACLSATGKGNESKSLKIEDFVLKYLKSMIRSCCRTAPFIKILLRHWRLEGLECRKLCQVAQSAYMLPAAKSAGNVRAQYYTGDVSRQLSCPISHRRRQQATFVPDIAKVTSAGNFVAGITEAVRSTRANACNTCRWC